MEQPWRQFEEVVAQFLASLEVSAKVTHDIHLPDRDTGKPRQRDVWIEWNALNHFPTKMLVSCKRWSKPLDQKDIDHFNGEFLSSRAHIGVIYSYSGFNDNAVEKARALGFHCCQLLDDAPSPIPRTLVLGLAYLFRVQWRVSASVESQSY
ncbi:MAG: restriction endonuclease, partial [Phycisphaerales bacterium JB063]